MVVVGGNRGIGLSFVKAFSALSKWEVVATARDPSSATALSSLDQVQILPLDISDTQSVATFATALANTPVDLLVNVSGILLQDTLKSRDLAETMMTQFRVNSVGHLLTTKALLPNLRAASNPTVACISSKYGSIGDNPAGGGLYGLRASKAALNMIVANLAKDLPDVTVVALHPGFVKTDMTKGFGEITPDEAVIRMNKILDSLTNDSTGKFFHSDGHILPW